MLQRFFTQPNRDHRNLHIVLGLLGLHFLVASLVYVFSPNAAIAQLRQVGALLGQPYPVSEVGHVWRVLAAGNVFTLAFLCFAIQANVRRFEPFILAFLVLKLVSAFGYLAVFLVGHAAPWTMLGYPFLPFVGVFVWDSFNAWLVWFFGRRAYRSLADTDTDPATLVPPLLFERP